MSVPWWKQMHRIIQTNLQLNQADMDTARLIHDIKELGADGLVFNVGGIYAWYPTDIPFHTINPLLPPGRDLVGEVAGACHKAGILFIARFDFSKAEDKTYYRHPEWFIRLEDNKPQIVAPDRPGSWPLLMSTCTNGDYQREGLAFPVLREVLSRYEIDGAFITSMIYAPCNCEICRRKYRQCFGAPLPATPLECDPRWFDICMEDSIRDNHNVIRDANPNVAFFHRASLWGNMDSAAVYKQSRWWFTDPGEYDIFFTNPPDVVHGETHDMPGMSLLRDWAPAAAMNLCRTLSPNRPPVDIVHTAPGLSWRHTGLPPAEHMFWIAQVGASGGSIWHSFTGTPETQQDKRILQTVREYDRKAALAEPLMEGAKPAAQVGLVWNSLGGYGWIEMLVSNHIPYGLLLASHITAQTIQQYEAIIFPEYTKWNAALIAAAEDYVTSGGSILLEGRIPSEHPGLEKLTGCQTIGESESLKTAYFRLEDPKGSLGVGLETITFIPFAGKLAYEVLESGTQRLCSLVPPFSPEEGAGSPPERAVMLVDKTDISAASLKKTGKGLVLHLPYAFHKLLDTYRLPEHYRFADNCIRMMLGGTKQVETDAPKGVQITVFESEKNLLIHLVNGVGSRPLGEIITLYNITVKLSLREGQKIQKAFALFKNEPLKTIQNDAIAHIMLKQLDSWQLLVAELI